MTPSAVGADAAIVPALVRLAPRTASEEVGD